MLLLHCIVFLVGIVLTLKGADWLTDGASAVARRLRVSSLVIGLTVVAFGTSAPELAVSCLSAAHSQTEMALGNVVGSNIFNLLAIMGVTALVKPVVCSPGNIRYDVPFCLVASIVVTALAIDDLDRGDGIALLCFLGVFVAYTLSIARKDEGGASQVADSRSSQAHPSTLRSALLILLGLACLVVGGELFVRAATGIALALGVSQSVIALTIVAAGTSLPELVTSAMAAAKGDTDMALGNVVGSCVLNLFLVLGAAACISPLLLGNMKPVDFGTMLGAAVLVWLFCRFGDRTNRKINRWEGALLVLSAIAYYSALLIGS